MNFHVWLEFYVSCFSAYVMSFQNLTRTYWGKSDNDNQRAHIIDSDK